MPSENELTEMPDGDSTICGQNIRPFNYIAFYTGLCILVRPALELFLKEDRVLYVNVNTDGTLVICFAACL